VRYGALCVAVAALIEPLGGALAEPIIVGGSGLPAVELNPAASGVSASGTPSEPRVLSPAAPSGEGITLKPPEGIELVVTHTQQPILVAPKPVATAAPTPQPAEPPASPEEPAVSAPVAPAESQEAEQGPAEPRTDETSALAAIEAVTAAALGVELSSKEQGASAAAAPLAASEGGEAGATNAPAEAEPPAAEASSATPSAAPAEAPEGSAAAAQEGSSQPAAALDKASSSEETIETQELGVAEAPDVAATAGAEVAASAVAPTPEAAGAAPESATVAALESPAIAAAGTSAGARLRLSFAPQADTLPPGAEAGLGELAAELQANPEARLQLKAYAAGTPETASQARRLALSRALAVRSFLIERGIRSTRIDVRALGIPEDDGPEDRVDVVIVAR